VSSGGSFAPAPPQALLREDDVLAREPGASRRRSSRGRWWAAGRQRAAGLLLTVACVAGASWFVVRVAGTDERMLTGTVTNNGVIALNFARAGEVATVVATAGERVRKGQVLATQESPAGALVLRADRATIGADRAKLSEAVAGSGPAAEIAAARAQIDKDRAQLAIDRASVASSRIVAPGPGTVMAVNGQPGDYADALGIRDYTAAQPAGTAQQPLFSLLPEAPQDSLRSSGTGSGTELPLVELRTSASWEVVVLVPENAAATIHAGQAVTVAIPAAHLSGLAGRLQELLPTPVDTSNGVAYQAVVTVPGRLAHPPLSGMAADVYKVS
jgi:membrane fusion protein, macrolide-specific efflux system